MADGAGALSSLRTWLFLDTLQPRGAQRRHGVAGSCLEPRHAHQGFGNLFLHAVHLGEPLRRISGGIQHGVQLRCLAHPNIIEIDASAVMMAPFTVKPIALHFFDVGMEPSEHAVRHNEFPGIAGDLHPTFRWLGAGDDNGLALGGLIGDPVLIRRAPARRVHPFPVGAGMHGDGVAALRDRGCGRNGLERVLLADVVFAGLGGHDDSGQQDCG
jgi:hypothetical protein